MRSFRKIIKLKFSSKNLSSLINISFAYARSHMHTQMAEMLHAFGLRGC